MICHYDVGVVFFTTSLLYIVSLLLVGLPPVSSRFRDTLEVKVSTVWTFHLILRL